MCIFLVGSRGRTVLFFDPLGNHYNHYHQEIRWFVDNNANDRIICTQFPIQSRSSVMCGEYCMYFLLGFIEWGNNWYVVIEKMYWLSEVTMLHDLWRKLNRKIEY